MAAIDRLYRSILAATRFFSKGWGPTDVYESLRRFNPTLVDRVKCCAAVEGFSNRVSLTKVSTAPWGTTSTGRFQSPTVTLLPNMLPPEAEIAQFQLVLPSHWKTEHRPVYIHLAGTGDHGFYRRRQMTVLPLLKNEGIGAVILENPFYGTRKPRKQTRSQLLHVSDLFLLGLSIMLECLVIKKWLEGEGLGPVGLTGISMGGHNASLSAAVWPEPVPVVPCLSWSTASSVFTQGILSNAVCWNVLEEQLLHCRDSANTIRKNIFEFALAQQAGLSEWYSAKESGQRGLAHSCTERTVLLSSVDSERQNGEEMVNQVVDVRDCHHSLISTKKAREGSQLHWETVSTLKAVLDLSTHLCNYPVPLATELAKFVVAKKDLYVPRCAITSVEKMWPGCEVRYIGGGHVSATVLQQKEFQSAISEKMQDRLNCQQTTK